MGAFSKVFLNYHAENTGDAEKIQDFLRGLSDLCVKSQKSIFTFGLFRYKQNSIGYYNTIRIVIGYFNKCFFTFC